MNSSYLSYQPNDYFWVTVKDDFDFSVCDKFLEKVKTTEKHPSYLISGIINSDSSCNCPTTPVATPKYTNNVTTGVTTMPMSSDKNTDEYTKQVCHNYLYSKQLINLQNQTSASQLNFSDNTDAYNKLIHQTLHVSVGILAILITET